MTLDRSGCSSCLNKVLQDAPVSTGRQRCVGVSSSRGLNWKYLCVMKLYIHRYPHSNSQSQSCSQKRFDKSWRAAAGRYARVEATYSSNSQSPVLSRVLSQQSWILESQRDHEGLGGLLAKTNWERLVKEEKMYDSESECGTVWLRRSAK